jgi:dihydropteroate synthase
MTIELDCGGRVLDLARPQVMGILNVTPDSFSDGGAFVGVQAAIDHARRMEADGAAVIDIGGESTRPGSRGVSVQEELDRVIPVIEALRDVVRIPLSVDTSKPNVMREAAAAGAGLINDVMALRREGAAQAASATALPVCLMHMQGTPRDMQDNPSYRDAVAEIKTFLLERVDAAIGAGIDRDRLILDPGFGFGKTDIHNAQLLRGLDRLVATGIPVLAGLSRKSLVGRVLGRDMPDRLAGSVAAAALATWQGARIIRAHDVAETVDAVRLATFVADAPGPSGPG